MPMTHTLVTLAEIEAAAARIRPVARVTPLIEVRYPSSDGNAAGRLFLKCENLQPMGAFKIRGAYNMSTRSASRRKAPSEMRSRSL